MDLLKYKFGFVNVLDDDYYGRGYLISKNRSILRGKE